MDSTVSAIVQTLPFTGPLIVLLLGAIGVLYRRVERVQDLRVSDAQATTAALVAVNTQTNAGLAGLTAAMTALKDSQDDLCRSINPSAPSKRPR